MFRDEILENEKRRKIYALLKEKPGLHIREIQRILDIPLATLQHHLNYMARRNVIYEEKTEHYTRYYCTQLDAEDKRILTALRLKRPREIVMILLASKKAKYRTIVEAMGLPNSTVSFYLKYLLDNRIVQRTKIGYENIYTLMNEDKIARVLIAYKSNFLDTIVDKWAATWLENRKDGSEEQTE